MNKRNDVWCMACNSPPFAYSWKHPQPIATTHASSAVLSALQRLVGELCQVPESVQTWTDECCWLCMIEAASLMYLLQTSLASCLRCCCLKLEEQLMFAAPTMIEMHRSSVKIGGILSLLILLRLSWFFTFHFVRVCEMWDVRVMSDEWRWSVNCHTVILGASSQLLFNYVTDTSHDRYPWDRPTG